MTVIARERIRSAIWCRRARLAAKVVPALGYPLAILLASRFLSPRYVGCLLILLLWLQRGIGIGAVSVALRRLTRVDWCVAVALSGMSLLIAAADNETLLRLYPACVNAGLLAAFGATLCRGPSMIEKFARMSIAEPTPPIVRYSRRVTQIWCAFFIANGAFSVYTALHWTRAAWSLYNGAIVYLLIGALLAGEWLWRQYFVKRRHAGDAAA